MKEAYFFKLHILLLVACCELCISDASAQNLSTSLSKIYDLNPDINEQRASVRSQDEEVSKAKAGMRPKAHITVNGGPQRTYIKAPAGIDQFSSRRYQTDEYSGNPRSATFNFQQPIFDGWKTKNATRQAESGVFSARAKLSQAEQDTLFKGLSAYMDVYKSSKIVELTKNNLKIIKEQFRITKILEAFGDATEVDTSQAEAAISRAENEFNAAESELQKSISSYTQLVGEKPGKIDMIEKFDHLIPKTNEAAINIALIESPSIKSALHDVDAAEAAVRVSEAALLPNASVGAQVIQSYDSYFGYPNTRQFGAQALATLNVPIYQGGSEYSIIRQSKEQLGKARMHLDSIRNTVQDKVNRSYSDYSSSKKSLLIHSKLISSSENILKNTRIEAELGQKTQLDVLNAIEALTKARIDYVTSQRDSAVSAASVLVSIGRFSARDLKLDVKDYDAATHLEQIADMWVGMSTASGN